MYVLVSLTTPAPARRRLWQHAHALAARGHRVRVLSPRRSGQTAFERIDGIEIQRFRMLLEGRTRAGLMVEYSLLFLWLLVTLLRLSLFSSVSAIQFCNPPDWSVLAATVLRRRGTRVVLDLADLTPLLYEAKFQPRGPLYRLSCVVFATALRRADLVVTANDLFRRYAIRIAPRSPSTTVRVASYLPLQPICGREAGQTETQSMPRAVIGYFGVTGTHDGVERLVSAAALLRRRPESPPFCVAIVGDGPALPALRRLAQQQGLGDTVRFHGFLEGNELNRVLQTFHVAVIPDPVNRYSHTISMNKLFVLAGMGLPIVSTPLRQTRRLLRDAACYAVDDSPLAIADSIGTVLLDTALRQDLSRKSHERSQREFRWRSEADRYVEAMERLNGSHR